MYHLNKFVGLCFSPLGLTILMAVAALGCLMINRRRLANRLGIVALVWLWLWMTPLLTCLVGAPLEREFLVDGAIPPVTSFPRADAIVILGGSMGTDAHSRRHAEMWSSADRVWHGARLWKAGKAPLIIATGDRARESTLGLLTDFGVDENRVAFLNARNTEEEAKGIARLLAAENPRPAVAEPAAEEGGRSSNGATAEPRRPNKRILLVTSAWHQKRARMMFEKYAKEVSVVCAPADFEMTLTAANISGLRRLRPETYSFHLNTLALHEWVGLAGYRLLR
jgi:uncharacterized SAM-binding protein YcdF (DUF218 family)